MSLLMDALRKAEQAKGGADTPAGASPGKGPATEPEDASDEETPTPATGEADQDEESPALTLESAPMFDLEALPETPAPSEDFDSLPEPDPAPGSEPSPAGTSPEPESPVPPAETGLSGATPDTEPAESRSPVQDPAPMAPGEPAPAPAAAMERLMARERRRRLLVLGGGAAALLIGVLLASHYLLGPPPAMPAANDPVMAGDEPATSPPPRADTPSADDAWRPAPVDPSVLSRQVRRHAPPVVPHSASGPDPIPSEPRPRVQVSHRRLPPDRHRRLVDAYQAYRKGDLDTAGRLYRQVLARSPADTDALLGLAAIALRQGRPAAARQLYLQVRQRHPTNTAALAGLALSDRQAPLAVRIAEVRSALRSNPQDGRLYLVLGDLRAAQADWGRARKAYAAASRLLPGDPRPRFDLAVALDHLGRPVAALANYRGALRQARPEDSTLVPAARTRIGQLERQIQEHPGS